MTYERLALEILLINEIKHQFNTPIITDDMAIKKSNDFYKSIFNDRLKNIDDKIDYVADKNLTSYEGFCKPTGFSPKGISKVTIILPKEESVKKIVTISHEKAHAYHMLSNTKTSELIPSFLDILNSLMLDKEFPGIKIDNINYKIREAKKVASLYLKHKQKYNIKKQEDYMKDFAMAIFLVKKYLSKDKSEITEMIIKNLLGKESLPIYKDEIEVSKIIEFIRN